MDRRFPKEARIRNRSEYLRLQAKRGGKRTPNFVVLLSPARNPIARIGITVTKRVGGAVERNRVKRRVREFFRNYRDLLQPPQDIVVIARTGAHELSFKDVESQLAKIFRIDPDAHRLR